MTTLHGASKELQSLEDQVPNRTDWKYEMRREAQEILPGPSLASGPPPRSDQPGQAADRSERTGLYVGPFQPSTKRDILNALGVTHILCIAETREAQVCELRTVSCVRK